MHRKKVTIMCAAFTAAALLLAACGQDGDGGGQENVSDSAVETDYSYVPEYTELGGGEFVSFQDIQFAESGLYYVQVFFDVVNQRNVPVLKQYSLTKKEVLRERDALFDLEDGRSRQLGRYYVLGDGSMYTAESLSSSVSRSTLLCSYDPDWNLRWEQDITAIMDEVERYGQVDHVAADGEGRICLAVGNGLCLFDREGACQGTVVPEDVQIHGLGVGRDGKVYVCYQEQQGMGQSGYCLAQVDFEKKELGAPYQNFPEGKIFTPGPEEDFLIIGGSCLYGYDLDTQSAKELLAWADCGLDGHGVKTLGVGGDGELAAFYQDFEATESYLLSLRKVETAMLPEKTQIVLGYLYGRDIRPEVAAFNRQSTSSHVTLVSYDRGDIQDSVDALNRALATGVDCPDILILDGLVKNQVDIASMAGNGAFADLEPFLESSGQDYLENALDCYRYQGQLVGIPCMINLETIVGGSSDLGLEPGWTLEEMMAYAAAHPEQELFDWAVRGDILQDCLAFGLDDFIDWETGQCHFNSEDFQEFLAFAGTFPAEYDNHGDDRSRGRKIQEGDVLLCEARISNFYAIQEYPIMFGEPVAYIGYPTAEGSGCIADYSGAMALAAQSQNQEEAWEFVEFYMERIRNSIGKRAAFSTEKSTLEQQMEEAVTVSYYLDEEGNPLLDEEGKPVPKGHGGFAWSLEDETIMFRTATQEEVDRVEELILSARPLSIEDYKIMDIIREEAEPFFQGQKSVEEAADVIQSRVQLYLDEKKK